MRNRLTPSPCALQAEPVCERQGSCLRFLSELRLGLSGHVSPVRDISTRWMTRQALPVTSIGRFACSAFAAQQSLSALAFRIGGSTAENKANLDPAVGDIQRIFFKSGPWSRIAISGHDHFVVFAKAAYESRS